MEQIKTHWFPAKRYGWGWGLPSVWQGWLVMAVFTLLLVCGAVFLLPSAAGAFATYSLVLSALLVAVCWLKGEPPNWHWGDK